GVLCRDSPSFPAPANSQLASFMSSIHPVNGHPPVLWDQIPPMVQTALSVIMETAERRIVMLERGVAELKEQLRRNSQNSSRPPSADGPHWATSRRVAAPSLQGAPCLR